MSAQAPAAPDPLKATEQWFVRHGLPYFVPGERRAAHEALRPRRLLPVALLVGLAGVVLAVLLSMLSEDLTFAPATLTLIGVVAGFLYAVTALRARPLLTWALTRTLGSIRQLVPMVTRALPLLLIFVTFLFINADVWQVGAQLDGGVLWLTVLLFTLMGVGFFLVRLPEEIDRADDALDARRIAAVCAGTPVGEEAARLARQRGPELEREVQVSRYERANLTLALLVTQTSQVLLLAVSLLVFFLVFGALAMNHAVVERWIGEPTHHLAGLANVSAELLQVSVFLAGFSGLYFTVYVVTDETYRDQFFTGVMRDLERAIAIRAVYTLVRAERGVPCDEVWEDAPYAEAPVAPDPDPTLRLTPVHDDRPG